MNLRQRIIGLAQAASLEIGDPAKLSAALGKLGNGREVFINDIAAPGRDPVDTTIRRAVIARKMHLRPVPHIAVRNYADIAHLEKALSILHDEDIDKILLLAGDNPAPGEIKDTLQILQDGTAAQLFSRYGIKKVAFAGHPEGNPHSPSHAATVEALHVKTEFIRRAGLHGQFITQLSLRPQRLVSWGQNAKSSADITLSAGIYGPLAHPHRIVKFALKNYGWGHTLTRSPAMLHAYAFSRLHHKVPLPDRLILALAQEPTQTFGHLHIFTFGQVTRSVDMLIALQEGRFDLVGKASGNASRLHINDFARNALFKLPGLLRNTP